MLPKRFKTDNLKTYYFLDKECNWAYLRYINVENCKISYHVFIYHINNCDNTNGVENPRACVNRRDAIYCSGCRDVIYCSGCGVEISETIKKQAACLWMMETTKYGG